MNAKMLKLFAVSAALCATFVPAAVRGEPVEVSTVEALTAALAGEESEIVLLKSGSPYVIAEQLDVTRAVTLRGETGNPADVTIDAQSKCRVFSINHAEAVVEGVRIYHGKNPKLAQHGGGVLFGSAGGTLRNCIVESCVLNQNTDSWYGGGIYLTGNGLVTGCVIKDCYTDANCAMTGIGVYIVSGTLEKSLVYGNCRTKFLHGRGTAAAVYLKSGTIDRCTIAGNTLMNGPLTVEDSASCVVQDTIVWGNVAYREAGAGKPNVNIGAKAQVSGLCTTGAFGANPLVQNPSFVNPAAGDYRLSPASPCIGAGTGGCDLGYADYDAAAAKAGINVSAYGGVGSVSATVTLVPADGESIASVVWEDSVAAETLTSTDTSFTHTFGPGIHTLTAHVSYGDGSEGDVVLADAIKVTIDGVVDVNDSASFNAALDLAGPGTEIRVAEGNYELALENYFFTDAVRIIGTGDRDQTILTKAKGVTGRFFYLGNADAAVCNLTMKNGNSTCPGGGIWIAGDGGMVSNCVIQGCSVGASQGAGGVLMESANALLTHSLVKGNTSGNTNGKGGGIYLSKGTVANCLIVGNTAGNKGSGNLGGGVYIGTSTADAKVVNCTIAGNTATKGGGIYREKDAGFVYNSIVYDNTVSSDTKDIYVVTGGKTRPEATAVSNCCLSHEVGANCQITDVAPYEAGTYELTGALSAKCINKGENEFVVSETDYAGVTRIFGGTVDIGAYEYCSVDIIPSFTVDKSFSAGKSVFTFTASLQGADIAEATCRWYLDGAAEVAHVGQTFSAELAVGVHAVRLVVTVGGSDYEHADAAACTVYPTDAYVGIDTLSVWPYETPETAATNFHEAVDGVLRSGVTLHVAAGSYLVTNTVRVTADERIVGPTEEEGEAVVYSTQNPKDLKNNFRLMTINGVNAWVEGLCISNGHAQGGGVYITGDGGTFTRGRIVKCTGSTNQAGGGVLMNCSGAVLSRTVLADNETETWEGSPDGAGVDFSGGGASISAGLIENCLFIGNKAKMGGAINLSGGTVRNCTIVGNTAGARGEENGGGVKLVGGVLENCIVWGNTDKNAAEGSRSQNVAGDGSTVRSCCIPVEVGESCVTNDPCFKDAANGDYRIGASSPCAYAGTYGEWMDGATDFFGNPRTTPRSKKVSIGYCQAPNPGMSVFLR